jgi:nicotinate phosphoribosyltransferase
MLDEAGLPYVKIVASNDLDEFIIADILAQGGKIDIWGIGTNLVTGSGDGGGALGGIYKMAEHNGAPKIKISSNPEKITNPGRKKIVRFYDKEGLMEADALAGYAEDCSNNKILIIDPNNPLRRKILNSAHRVELMIPIVNSGKLIYAFPSLEHIRNHRKEQLSQLHESFKRLYNPHEYKVGLTDALLRQKERMIAELAGK